VFYFIAGKGMESWDESAAPTVAELPEIKLFGKWSTEDVQVSDISLTVSIKKLSAYSCLDLCQV
jgi:hypothetical protein